MKNKNKIIKHKDYYELVLCDKNRNEIGITKIDIKDYNKIKKYRWCKKESNGKYYVVSRINYKFIYLHNFIFGDMGIDHKNGDSLDNRNNNLRKATHQQNCMNKKTIGIDWHKQNKKWIARIKINQKPIYLGSFKIKVDAIKIRRQAEQKYFGEFAYNYN